MTASVPAFVPTSRASTGESGPAIEARGLTKRFGAILAVDRLARLRALLPDEVVLEIDGGISLETIDEARDAGCDLFVAGSSVFGAPDPALLLATIRRYAERTWPS